MRAIESRSAPTLTVKGKEYYGQLTERGMFDLYEVSEVGPKRISIDDAEYYELLIPYLTTLKASKRMTLQTEIANDPKYVPVLDYGFVGLVDTMGTDASIVQAARVSYGDGTKTVLEDRGLIRYLMRHKHTSPFEMCQIKLHIKMPIFVMRQWVRHRTASLNEYSGRYSVMTDEFYMPEPDVIQPQSKDNKQGRTGALGAVSTTGVRWMMEAAYSQSYDIYQALLGEKDESKYRDGEVVFDPYSEDDPLFGDDFNGIAREMARCVLPVANYTELYWTQNLHNMMHLLKLRMDPHAQYEIRVFADAVYDLIKPIYPEALQAFDDYVREAKTLSRMESDLTKRLFTYLPQDVFAQLVKAAGGDKAFAEENGMSLREFREFVEQWGLNSKTTLAAPTIPVAKTPAKRKTPAKATPKAKAPVKKPAAKPLVEGRIRKGGINTWTEAEIEEQRANRPPPPAPMRAAPGGPSHAADGSPMGWVGNEWLPVGTPPPGLKKVPATPKKR
jgi:thymidylate synthase (FAD)